jgi:hypothetical protein
VHDPVTAVALVTVRLVGQTTVRPDVGLTTSAMLTVPVNPLSGVTVIVEDEPVAPVLKLTGEVAVKVKSFVALKVKVAVTL